MNHIIHRLAAVAAAVCLLCTGCGAGGRVKHQDLVTLRTVSMFGEGDSAGPAYQGLLESYSRSRQSVMVEDASEVSSEEWKKGVLDSFAGEGTEPDVLFFFTGADVRSLILNDKLVSVEEIQQLYPDYGANIRESTMAFMREFDGEHYAVPVKGFWEGLFCNRDLFLKYGAPLPEDWESFQEAIRIFSENGIVPVAVSLKEVPHYWIEHLILSEGGAVEHKLNPKGYVPPSWVKGVGWFRTLYGWGAFPEDTFSAGNAEVTDLFLNKEAAMILDGSWLVQSITDQENTIVLPMPAAPGGKMQKGDIISGFSSGYYITRKAWDDPKKREAAVDFVRYMTSEQSISAMCEMGGAPAMDIIQSGGDSALQASAGELQQNAGNACMPIDSKLYKDAWQSLCQDILEVVQGTCTAQDAVGRVAELNQW